MQSPEDTSTMETLEMQDPENINDMSFNCQFIIPQYDKTRKRLQYEFQMSENKFTKSETHFINRNL